ncbi:transcriptional activator domain protein (plasmid) [Solidesulfovibrio carbinoliphilus subsp. oakridgensis]|uniref:protein O-GlcNAc transferase n=1 Tax=Solidesulfovibrio carbinoliphilus subsp. oakridgensis TaxID=694327 RepID=G7QEB8_9BACT|nr:tetratricopeptide repeat protein [Solidesulfovibrio carbinoliphilus]EHJ46012.1 transcriptional activator domain protein [Solidesulfovibrio carbinoliphilus subsp. oakridgensis]
MKNKYQPVYALLQQGLFPQAAAAAKALVAQNPRDARAWLAAGRVHEALRQPGPAEGAFSKAVALEKGLLEAWEGRVQSLLALGRCDEAAKDATRVLTRQPGHVPMLLALGTARHQAGRRDEAAEAYRRALAAAPGQPFATVSLAQILLEQGQAGQALAVLDDCPAGEQRDGRVALKRAEALWALARRDEARAVAEAAAARFPQDDAVRATLGRYCYEAGETEAAVAWLRQAAHLAPQNPWPRTQLCAALLRLGRIEEAWVEGERAVLTGAPLPDACLNLGNVHRARGDAVTAELCYRRALAIHPGFATAVYNLGVLAQENGRFGAAEALYRQCLGLDAHRPDVHGNLGVVQNILGRPTEALAALQTADALGPDNPHTLSNILLTALHCDTLGQEELTRLHFSFGERFEKPAAAPARRSRDGKLRIGYVSSDFKRHSVAYFLQELWRHHDRERFQVHAYHAFPGNDDMTERLKSLADQWRDIAALSDAQAAACVREDGIDILIDLGGHTSGNRLPLFAQRPAPVQVTYLGYPATTGLRHMDVRLTDELADPPGQTQEAYTERLEYLPAPFLCYCPPAGAPDVAEPPMGGTGAVTFGSFNKLAKLSDTTLALWKEILAALPRATLRIKDIALSDPGCRAALAERCARAGLPMDRLALLPGSPTRQEHLSQYGTIDIALDTFPYHGTTTTCEALWMGVPVVTLIGEQHHSRVGLSVLSSLDATAWAATDKADYIGKAVALASDPAALRAIRHSLRETMRRSPLLDGRRLARDLEKALETIWERSPAGRPGQ